jgi:outer membrane receptor protein involved in Fe transport
MGVLGLSHTYIYNSTTYSKLTIAGTYQQHKSALDSIVPETYEAVPYSRRDLQMYNLIGSFYVNKKFSSKNNLKIGITVNRIGYDMLDSAFVAEDNGFRLLRDEKDNTWFGEAYAEWMHKFSDVLVVNAGLHYQYLTLNGSQALEPRAGIRWTVSPRHTVSFGYGMHSKVQMPQVYFIRYRKADGSFYKPNEELGFTTAHHFVLGYDFNISETLRLKAETYYQMLDNAPVERVESSFSMLNHSSMQWQVPDSLINGGPGRNFGIELTLEKFMDRGLYFLITTSLFDSKYKGSDGVLRSTAFDSRYVVNALAGKEFKLKNKKPNAKLMKWIVTDIKLTTAGGQRYTPIDFESSQEQGQTVYFEDKAFTQQFKDYFRLDLRLAFRMDFKGVSQEFAVDIQNLTDRENPLYIKYNKVTGEEQVVNQIGIIPMMQYRIVF